MTNPATLAIDITTWAEGCFMFSVGGKHRAQELFRIAEALYRNVHAYDLLSQTAIFSFT